LLAGSFPPPALIWAPTAVHPWYVSGWQYRPAFTAVLWGSLLGVHMCWR